MICGTCKFFFDEICDVCDVLHDKKQDCRNCWVYKIVESVHEEENKRNPEYCSDCELEFDSAECWGNESCIVDMKIQ